MGSAIESEAEALVRARARLLRAHALHAPDRRGLAGVLLTFDSGTWIVEPDPQSPGLRGQLDPEPIPPPDRAEACDEDEPWWRVLGNPLCRARTGPDALELQFREDDANPRIVSIERSEAGLRVSLRPLPPR